MRLIVFGDSYGQPHEHHWLWYKQVSQSLDCTDIVNFALRGSSIEYSLSRLDYYLQNDYREDDKIIFLTTLPVRAPMVAKGYDPTYACLYNIDVDHFGPSVKDSNFSGDIQEHLLEHRAYYKSHAKMIDYVESLYKILPVAGAMNLVPNDAIMIMLFDQMPMHVRKLLTKDNLYVPDMCLYHVSEQELDKSNFPESVSNLGMGDRRPNHLSKINHNVLSECIVDTFNNRTDCFSMSKFQKNILRKDNVHKFLDEWTNKY